MSVICPDCRLPLLWNDDAISAVCTSCGALADPSQSFLSSPQYSDVQPSLSTTLKRFRAGSNWALAGQSKEARFSKNTYSIHQFINSLALALSAPGLSPRACTLFDQAMSKGSYRWGTKAKLVAGVCLSIALRESGRPDTLKDISYLIEQPPLSLTRTLASVLSVLNLVLPSSELSHYLPTLQSHLFSAIQQPPESSGFHLSLYSELKSISIQSATETARSLMELLPRFSSDLNLAHSLGALASAALILGLEAEKRGTLPHLADISIYFATRFQISKGTIMLRYKNMQDEIAKWIEELHWLDSYHKSGSRSKLSKRLLCARGLKDAIDWKDEIWRKKVEASERPILVLDLDEGSSVTEAVPSSSDSCSTMTTDLDTVSALSRPRKKSKVSRTLNDATEFLINPHYGHTPSSSAPEAVSARSKVGASLNPSTFPSYLLSVSEPVAGMHRLPTRLQLLSVARGGAEANAISDEELFAEGEWEAMQRTPQEIQVLQEHWRRQGVLAALEKANQVHERRSRPGKGTKEKEQAGTKQVPKSKRIDLDAFALFMDGDGADNDLDTGCAEFLGLQSIEDDDEDEEVEQQSPFASHTHRQAIDCEEVVLDDWRPPSPDLGRSLDVHYDEEC